MNQAEIFPSVNKHDVIMTADRKNMQSALTLTPFSEPFGMSNIDQTVMADLIAVGDAQPVTFP